MQITSICFRNDNLYCYSRNTFKNFNNYVNLMVKTEKNKKRIIWIIKMHCGIVLDFILPKLAIYCRIRQHCLIGQSARTFYKSLTISIIGVVTASGNVSMHPKPCLHEYCGVLSTSESLLPISLLANLKLTPVSDFQKQQVDNQPAHT